MLPFFCYSLSQVVECNWMRYSLTFYYFTILLWPIYIFFPFTKYWLRIFLCVCAQYYHTCWRAIKHHWLILPLFWVVNLVMGKYLGVWQINKKWLTSIHCDNICIPFPFIVYSPGRSLLSCLSNIQKFQSPLFNTW